MCRLFTCDGVSASNNFKAFFSLLFSVPVYLHFYKSLNEDLVGALLSYSVQWKSLS